jgi:multidrug efflux pump subunit AcrA (membrane-fusion protein)
MTLKRRILLHWNRLQEKHRIRFGLFSILFCLLILAGCSLGEGTPTPAVELQVYEPDGTIAEPISSNSPENSLLPTVTPVAVAAALSLPGEELAPYSGNVIAEEQIGVAVEVIGQVLKLNVEVGDSVKSGDVLLELEKTTLEARRAQALAGLEAAQAQLDLLLEEPNESALEAARAAVAAAEAAYQRALEGPTEEDLRAAEAQLRQAEAAVGQAQAAYDQVKGFPNVGALPQSLQLQQATLQAEAARAQYDKLVKGATPDLIAAAYAQLSQARAQLDSLEQGPKEGQIRAAEAQVRQAETGLYLAQVELDKATVRSPMDGVILAVNTTAGAQAAPGAPVFTIQTNTVKVEIAVEEVRLSQIRLGQPARIRVSAYPDRVFDGEIALIAPALDPETRTVKTTIRPTGDAADLRPGMFATVELLP